MKKLKPRLTSSDIIHHFANRTAKAEQSGDYSFENDKLYYGSYCIAKILSIRKKIVVINNNWSTQRGWNNGKSWYSISKSFSKDWIQLWSDKPAIAEYNIKSLYRLYFSTIKDGIFHLVDTYQSEKEIVNNSAAYQQVHHSDINITYIFDLAKQLKLSENKIKKYIYNENHTSTIRYKSWGKVETNTIKVDKPISFWIDKSKWHTEVELEIIKFKEWKVIWANKGGNLYGRTYKQVYDDPILKSEFEIKTTTKLNRLKREAEEEYERKRIENAKKEELLINDWKEGKSIGNLWNVPIQLRLRKETVYLTKINGTEPPQHDETVIETTMGARVPFSHGKRLFQFFMKCVKEEKPYVASHNNHSIESIGVYSLKRIDVNAIDWYIEAGCHIIYQNAIKDFINRYKLDW